ncbi:MAG: patatin-like phospholipase family protein [Chitinophagales bacterium]|jgi:NTE family protein|nr:patatin-like phospholipase family protein [Bacteroidota bacterium]MBK7566710.1 patatin-like phospholipase family protein [Bacteroidota bacterium]MBP9221173.1 patatin-like phospholipase family protein [Chitinophagales bacterium]MBP9795350.1 patatin-like phospholipase family protein [Chitinophagales bacterium]
MQHKIGITLSGGGARGIAHIGVLQALESAGIFPDVISGCSAGAMVGALYAEGYSPRKIYSLIENKSIYSIIKMGLPNKGMMELVYFRKILTENIAHDTFEQLKKPFYTSVTNLNTGNCEIIGSGKLTDYVIASQSIPLVFKPLKIGEYLYVDGGVLNNLPVEPVRDQCDILIGVNVTPINYTEKLSGMRDVGFRILNLSLMTNMESRMKQCDFLIEPDTADYTIFDVNKSKLIYDAGYEAALPVAEKIIQFIKSENQ